MRYLFHRFGKFARWSNSLLPIKKFIFITLGSLMVSLIPGGLVTRGWAAGESGLKTVSPMEAFKPDQKNLAELTPLLVTASRFKTVAASDFEKALLMFCRAKGLQKMSAIDKGFWSGEQSQWAWNLFFSSAVHVPGGPRGDSGLVGYYNPFSDAFLLTEWASDGKIRTLVDAEMLMGDWLRNDTDVLDPVPLWLRGKVHRPVALGLAVAETVLAFERVFAAAPRGKWRARLPILQNDGALYDINYPALAVMLNNHLINVGAIADRETKDSALTVCRDQAGKVIEQASRGNVDTVFSKAANTLPETSAALKGIRPEWFTRLRVSGVLTDPEGTLILLTPRYDANPALSLFFAGDPKGHALERADLIDYQTFYNQLKFARHAAGAGKGGHK